jgi:hypothetical protein
MALTSRQIGDSDERTLLKMARSDGLLVIRSAGSLGPADLLALAPALDPARELSQVYALNVKRGAWAGPDDRRAMAALHRYNVRPWLCRCDTSGSGGRRAWSYRYVNVAGGMGEVDDLPPWWAAL